MHKPDNERWKPAQLRAHLLSWYDENRRDLPWRHSQDPYSIWVSEIMLQQTRVAVVVERYESFLARFPTLISLALAPEQDVLALWSGLGYYRRARMLHKAAQFVAENQHGNLPHCAEDLRKLPGIGAYTAAAIASIAHGEHVAVVDGNVERVLCRLAGWDATAGRDGAAQRRKVEQLAADLLDRARPGDFNQAMMELGATVCVPRGPMCGSCPLAAMCATRGEHKRAPRAKMLSREVGHALCLRKAHGPGAHGREILLEQRGSTQTVMPGMWELPQLREATVPEQELRMTVRHAIMQVNYYVRVRIVFEDDMPKLTVMGGERRWVPLQDLDSMALTGLARKVLTRARLLVPASSRIERREPRRGAELKHANAIA
ncbi:MAG TPA: A/G-specific adenine glycosylase [Terracidiphilus sp.]|nr:A/G-specific adenine glycosylase [Terracidiphilus sp.]